MESQGVKKEKRKKFDLAREKKAICKRVLLWQWFPAGISLLDLHIGGRVKDEREIEALHSIRIPLNSG